MTKGILLLGGSLLLCGSLLLFGCANVATVSRATTLQDAYRDCDDPDHDATHGR